MNVPPLLAISMATVVHRGDTDGIAQCGTSRATLEATGCYHRTTTCSILPQRLPGQQANKQQSTNTPTLLAILMAVVMRRYVTAHFAQWRKSRASLEPTGCPHWASIMSNNIKRTWLRCFFFVFHHRYRTKRLRVDTKTPVSNRGMTYQTKEKGFIKVSTYFVGEVTLTE